MDTDQLIRTLAADNAHRAPRVGGVLTLGLLVAAPLSILIFATFLGVRPDVMSAMHNPFFDMKFAVTLSLAIPAIIVSLHLSRPEALLRGWGWLLLLPVGLLAVAIGGEAMMAPAMSLPLLAGALFGLRHGAPSHPALAGALAGLVSAGLAATLYASHCTDDSPLFVATWYTLATALVAAIGALVGSKVLRY